MPVARLCSPARQAPPMLFLDIEGDSVFFASLISSSQLTLVLTETIKKQVHPQRDEGAARFWTVDGDRC